MLPFAGGVTGVDILVKAVAIGKEAVAEVEGWVGIGGIGSRTWRW
jgi:hypothetical protein